MKFSKLKSKIQHYVNGGIVAPNSDLNDEISGEGLAAIANKLTSPEVIDYAKEKSKNLLDEYFPVEDQNGNPLSSKDKFINRLTKAPHSPIKLAKDLIGSAVVTGPAKQEGVEDTWSPFDFVSPGMVASAGKGLVGGSKVLGQAGSAIARDIVENPEVLLENLKNNKGELSLNFKRELSNLKNPTPEKVKKIIGIEPTKDTASYKRNRNLYTDLLDFSSRHRQGIPESKSAEEALDTTINNFYPQIKEENFPVTIDPSIGKKGIAGSYRYTYNGAYPHIINPKDITLADHNIGTMMHEGEHFMEARINPFFRSNKELFPDLDSFEAFLGAQKSVDLKAKLKALNPWSSDESITKMLRQIQSKANSPFLRDMGRSIIESVNPEQMYDFTTGGHFYRYPTNFELNKSVELLDPSIKIRTPDLSKNIKIINDIWNDYNYGRIAEEQAAEEYIKRGFPNAAELIKNR
jgi:hypothetical protein